MIAFVAACVVIAVVVTIAMSVFSVALILLIELMARIGIIR